MNEHPTKEQSNDEHCPKCGSANIDVKERDEYGGETTWSDGLGSPGPLWFRVTWRTCKDCGRSWR